MNWDAIGALAELLGAGGVIVSLVYLATQIRSNTRVVKVSAYQQMCMRGQDINLAILTNSELFELGARRSGATSQEQIDNRRESALFIIYLHSWETQVYQFDQGLLEDHLWEVHLARMRNLTIRHPNFSDWWSKTDKTPFTPRLRSLVDKQLASGPRAG